MVNGKFITINSEGTICTEKMKLWNISLNISPTLDAVLILSKLFCHCRVCFVAAELSSIMDEHVYHFSLYNFLWRDDMYGSYRQFIESKPTMAIIDAEVEQLLKVEKKVLILVSKPSTCTVLP